MSEQSDKMLYRAFQQFTLYNITDVEKRKIQLV